MQGLKQKLGQNVGTKSAFTPILNSKKDFYNLVKLLGTTMVFKPNFYFILVLCPCNPQLNQISYVNSFLINLLKLNNRIDNKNK